MKRLVSPSPAVPDLQAVGGLYDSLALELFPAPLRALPVAQLPRLTAANFCAALGQPLHVDPDLPQYFNRRAIASETTMSRAE
jgi:hypothetical protein